MMWSASAIPGKCAATTGTSTTAAASTTRLMLAGGQILPVLRKLAPSNHDVSAIWALLRGTVHPIDLLVLSLLGWGTVPLFGVVYYYCFQRGRHHYLSLKRRTKRSAAPSSSSSSSSDDDEEDDPGEEAPERAPLSSVFASEAFLSSYMFHVADHVSQASRLAILVYLADCVAVLLTALGFSGPAVLHHPHTNLSACFAKILYIAWAAQRLSVFKRYLLGRVIHNQQKRRQRLVQATTSNGGGGSCHATAANGTNTVNGVSQPPQPPPLRAPRRSSATGDIKTLGQAAIIDRLVDGIIWVVTGLFLLDILNVEMGVGVSSIFAFGSAGTLVMGLASKDVASMFVSGLTLTTTDHVREGDHVKFGDGTTGQILRIGWMHTTIRGYDELVEVIPNSMLGMQRVKNISRLSMCQVKENLRLRYDDADRIKSCCDAILQEIQEACPSVITDGTRPFRAVLRGFEKDHLLVMVDVHFSGIKPIGTGYWNTRQEVLLAIHRAVAKSQCQFVTTLWPTLPSKE